MKIFTRLTTLGLVVVFSTGAAFIDKETKTGVLELNRKYDELSRKLDHVSQQISQKNEARYEEILKLLSEIRGLAAKKQTINVMTPPQPVAPPALSEPAPVAAPEAPLLVPATPPAVIPVEPKPTPEASPPPVALIPLPPLIVPEVRVSKNAELFALLAVIVAGISFIGLALLIVTVRRSDVRIRRLLWKSEIDHLRDDVLVGRPHLKVEKSYDRLTLTNAGSVVADDIKLSLGPAPATMKQRLRVLTRIDAGEQAEIEIGAQVSGEQLYGTLEYKNPENGRIYKDQFVLRIDGVTGQLIPIPQAS